VHAVLHELREGWQGRADHGRLHRKGLEEDVRDTEVAFRQRRQRDHAGLLIQRDELFLGQEAGDADPVVEAMTPDEALLQASAILRHHLDLFVDFDKETIEFEESQPQVSQENSKLKKLLNMSVNEIELSVRAANCLNNANITTVGQLAMKTEAEMLKYRNFGKKSLNEIKDKLQNLGLSLGMKLEPGLVELPASDAKAD